MNQLMHGLLIAWIHTFMALGEDAQTCLTSGAKGIQAPAMIQMRHDEGSHSSLSNWSISGKKYVQDPTQPGYDPAVTLFFQFVNETHSFWERVGGDEWVLKNVGDVPRRFYFQNASYDEKFRVFTGTLVFASQFVTPEGLSEFGTSTRWEYELHFRRDFKMVLGGFETIYDADGKIVETTYFYPPGARITHTTGGHFVTELLLDGEKLEIGYEPFTIGHSSVSSSIPLSDKIAESLPR